MKSIGLGDTIEKFTKFTGVKTLVNLTTKEKDCGCNKRKNWLNDQFPYKSKEEHGSSKH